MPMILRATSIITDEEFTIMEAFILLFGRIVFGFGIASFPISNNIFEERNESTDSISLLLTSILWVFGILVYYAETEGLKSLAVGFGFNTFIPLIKIGVRTNERDN